MKIPHRHSLTWRILFLFVGTSLLLAVISIRFSFWTVTQIAKYHEQKISEIVSLYLSNKLVVLQHSGQGIEKAFSDLALISPSLEPYIIDASNRIIKSPSPELIGVILPGELLANSSQSILNASLRCGPDPKQQTTCLSFAVMPLGNETSLYLVVRNGLSQFFSSPAAISHLFEHIWPKYVVSLVIIAVTVFFLALSFTRTVRAISESVARYKSANFSPPSNTSSPDELTDLELSIYNAAQQMDQAQQELSRSVIQCQQLFFSLAHDLRRPVTAFTLLTERILKHTKPHSVDWRGELSDVLAQESEFLSSLTLLVKTNSLTAVDLETFQLKGIILEAAKSLLPLSESRGVTFNFRIDFPSAQILGHPRMLFRAIMNLIDNAIRYSFRGGSVEVSLENRDGLALLQIRDTGIGVPPDELPHIFGFCYRAKNAQAHQIDGTGMGLATAASIIAAHKGRVWLESSERIGTTVKCLFPTSENSELPRKHEDPPVSSLTEISYLPRASRRWPVLEFAPVLLGLFLVGLLFGGHGSFLPWIWWILLCSISIALCVARSSGHNRILPLLSTASVVTWSLGQSFITSEHALRSLSLYFACQGILLGLTLDRQPLGWRFLPLRLILLIQTLVLFLQRSLPLDFALFTTGLFWGFLLARETTDSAFRGLGRRAIAVLFIINLGISSLPVLVYCTNYREMFFAQSSFSFPKSFVEILERVKALPQLDGSEEFLIDLGFLNPRIRWQLINHQSGELHAASLDRDSASTSSPALFDLLDRTWEGESIEMRTQNRQRMLAGIVPSIGTGPSFLLTALEESNLSEHILRKVSQKVLLQHALLFFSLSLLFTLVAVRIAISRLQGGIARISRALDGIDLSGPWARDELGSLLQNVQTFVKATMQSRNNLLRLERQSFEATHFLYESLHKQHHSLTEAIENSPSSSPSPQLINELIRINESQSQLLKEFMDYSSLLSLSRIPMEDIMLKELIEDAVLKVASRFDNIMFDYMDIGPAVIRAHAELMQIALESILGYWLTRSEDNKACVSFHSTDISHVQEVSHSHRLRIDIPLHEAENLSGHISSLDRLKAERIMELHNIRLSFHQQPDKLSIFCDFI